MPATSVLAHSHDGQFRVTGSPIRARANVWVGRKKLPIAAI
jgi:hypothetical protein